MIKLPASLTTIEDNAFEGCENLYGNVEGLAKVTSLGQAVFAGTHIGEERPTENSGD